jgi:hypothetical protein
VRDSAQQALALVRAPTLLIVGGLDDVVIDLNVRTAAQLRCEHRIEVVPGAMHLFEEAGKLDTVACLAREWFQRYFRDACSNSAMAAAQKDSTVT